MKWFRKKNKHVFQMDLNPQALQDLYDSCLSATAVYEFLKATGDDKLFPGFSSCYGDLKSAIRSAQQRNGAELGIQGGFTCEKCGCANSGSFDTCAECDTPRPS